MHEKCVDKTPEMSKDKSLCKLLQLSSTTTFCPSAALEKGGGHVVTWSFLLQKRIINHNPLVCLQKLCFVQAESWFRIYNTSGILVTFLSCSSGPTDKHRHRETWPEDGSTWISSDWPSRLHQFNSALCSSDVVHEKLRWQQQTVCFHRENPGCHPLKLQNWGTKPFGYCHPSSFFFFAQLRNAIEMLLIHSVQTVAKCLNIS